MTLQCPKCGNPDVIRMKQPMHYPLPGLPYRITLAVEGRPEAFDQYKPRRSEEMTSSKWFDTKDEAEAFCMGLSLGGRHEYFTRQADKKWEVKYWNLWR